MESPTFNHNAARYGILGVNPYGPSVLGTALETAGKTTAIFGKMGENRKQGLENKLLSDTLQSQIDLTNTKNATEAKYVPLNAEAGLGKTQAEIQELQARAAQGNAQAKESLERIRSGVYGAQAQETLAKTNLLNAEAGKTTASYSPTYLYNQLYKEYEATPYNSPKKVMIGGMLDDIVAQRMSPITGKEEKGRGAEVPSLPAAGTPEGTIGSAPRMSPMPQNIGGGAQSEVTNVNPYTISRQSAKGAEYGTQNPDGTFTAYQSPTQTTTSTMQARLGAQKELEILKPITAGLTPYTGNLGTIHYGKDLISAANGDKAASDRLQKAEEGMQVVMESAILRAKMAGATDIGKEVIESQLKQMYPSLPPNMLRKWNNPERIAAATENVNAALEKGINETYAPYVLAGMPVGMKEAPTWAPKEQPQSTMGAGYFTKNAADEKTLENFYGVPAQNQQQQQQPQEQPKQDSIADQITALAQYSVQKGEDPKQVESRMAEINTQAQEAIAQGADPAKVAAQIGQLMQVKK